MENNDIYLNVLLPTKSEIRDLIKRGIITSVPKGTDYADVNIRGSKHIDILTNNLSTICELRKYDDDKNIKYKFKKIEKEAKAGIMLIARISPDQIDKLKSESVGKIGNYHLVKLGKFPSNHIDDELSEKLEKEYRDANMALIDAHDVHNQLLAYNGQLYVRTFYYPKLEWFEMDDLCWIIDEEENKLVSLNIIGSIFYSNIDRVSSLYSDFKDCANKTLKAFKYYLKYQKHIYIKSKLLLTDKEKESSSSISVSYCSDKSRNDMVDKLTHYSVCLTPEIHFLVHYKPFRVKINYDEIKGKSKVIESHADYIKINYGEYPQSIVHADDAAKLEDLYSSSKLKKTGKVYTICKINDKSELILEELIEYEYNGQKYVRFNNEYEYECNGQKMSAVRYDYIDNFSQRGYYDFSKTNNSLWIKVEEITWSVDKRSNEAESDEILFILNNNGSCFLNFDANNYLKKHFIKEIQPSKLEYEINKQEKNNEEDIMKQIISRKKEKLALLNLLEKSVTIGQIINGNNLNESDIEVDDKGNVIIKGLKL